MTIKTVGERTNERMEKTKRPEWLKGETKIKAILIFAINVSLILLGVRGRLVGNGGIGLVSEDGC